MIRRSVHLLFLVWLAIAVGPAIAPASALAADRPPAPATVDPPASAGHALVYDDSLKSVLLLNSGLGGANSPPASARSTIWRWTGKAWILLDSSGPPIRNLGGVAYDSHRDVVVMFGGSYDLDHAYDDTWEWRRGSGWKRIDAAGPGKRDHLAMAYDPAHRQVVLFGGQIGLDSFPADTWIYDGRKWARIVQTDGPKQRVHHAMACDPVTHRVLLFGGFRPPSTPLGDTWSWSGTKWLVAAPAWAPRSHASLIATSRGIALLGGFPARESPAVAILGREGWRSENQPGNPGARFLTSGAYDPGKGVTLLFGGAGGAQGSGLYSDTWELGRTGTWRKIR